MNNKTVLENTPAKIKEQREKSVSFKNNLNLFDNTRKNERFFTGDQWLGNTTKSNLPLLNYNITGRIGEYKLSQILSNPLTASFCAEGIPSFMSEDNLKEQKAVLKEMQMGNTESYDALSKNEKINLLFSSLSSYYDSTSERLKLNEKMALAARDAYISGTGALYFYWDSNIDTGMFADSAGNTKILGDVECEVLSVTEQLDFENPTESDINKQDYIIISKMATVKEAKRIAKINGVSDVEIEKIKADSAENFAHQRSEEASDSVERVTIMTKLFKKYSEDGKSFEIHGIQVTNDVVIRPEWNLLLRRYPVAVFNWIIRSKCILGDSEVTNIIPNQIAVNRMITASVWNAMLTGMPILLVDKTKVKGEITNQPGQVWFFNGEDDIRGAATYLNPPSFSSALMTTSDNIIQNTLSCAGANDAALGELRSDNATAIIALREAATAPMQMLKNRYHQFAEDVARIIADFWFNLYGDRKLKISDKQGNWYLPFENDVYKDLVVSVRVDVGASSIWSQASAQQILDNLFAGGHIDFIQYLERLPKGLITDIQGLIDEFKDKQAEVSALAEQQNSVDNFSADDFYDSLTPENREKFDKMTFEEQKEFVEGLKNDIKSEGMIEDESQSDL